MQKNHWPRRIVLILGLLFLLVGCANPKAPIELKIAAAGSLTEAFQVLAQQFENTQDIPVVLSFAATGQLAQQIRNGAPYDVFAAADTLHIDALIEEGFLDPSTRTIYAQGELILIQPAGSISSIGNLPDLLNNDVKRIAIANPKHAPYGIAAKEALSQAGIWPEVQSKIIYGETVKQAAVIVATGNADVGFVARSVLDSSMDVILEIPTDLYHPILHVAAVSTNAKDQESASMFLEFLGSKEGRALLVHYGFSIP